MKSPARLGEIAPSTLTPSTKVEWASAGDSANCWASSTASTAASTTVSTGSTPCTLITCLLSGTLGEATDRGSDSVGACPTPSNEPLHTRPPGTFKVGTIAGDRVLISSSWFVVAGLIAVIMAPRVEQVQPGLGAGKYVAGLAFAVVLYLSVLLHEASHAVMARRYGFTVHSITLHFLGGMTAIEGEARTPRQEFVIAVVGPLTSLAVGAAADRAVVRHTRRAAADGGRGPGRGQSARRRAQPGARAAARRRPRAEGVRVAALRQRPHRHHRRRLGRTRHRDRRALLAVCHGATLRRRGRPARLRPVRGDRWVPLDRGHGGDVVGEDPASTARARRPRPGPADPRRA